MAIGAMYLNIKMIEFIHRNFQRTVIGDLPPRRFFLSRYHPGKDGDTQSSECQHDLRCDKVEQVKKMPNPKTVNPFMTPSDNEQRIPKEDTSSGHQSGRLAACEVELFVQISSDYFVQGDSRSQCCHFASNT